VTEAKFFQSTYDHLEPGPEIIFFYGMFCGMKDKAFKINI